MSDLNQINAALERLFNEEGQRIVFRKDPDQLLRTHGADRRTFLDAKFGDLLAEAKAVTGGKDEEG